MRPQKQQQNIARTTAHVTIAVPDISLSEPSHDSAPSKRQLGGTLMFISAEEWKQLDDAILDPRDDPLLQPLLIPSLVHQPQEITRASDKHASQVLRSRQFCAMACCCTRSAANAITTFPMSLTLFLTSRHSDVFYEVRSKFVSTSRESRLCGVRNIRYQQKEHSSLDVAGARLHHGR